MLKFIPLVGGPIEMFLGAAEIALKTKPAKMLKKLAGRSSSFFGDIARHQKGTSTDLFKAELGEKVQFSLSHPVQAVKKLSSYLERGLAFPERLLRTREAATIYRKAKEEGKSVEESTLLALEGFRESTINYARAGALARQINEVIPYTTASIAAKRKLFSALSGKDGKQAAMQAWGMGIVNLTALSMLIEFLHGDEEWYQDLPVWRKTRYWSFKDPITDRIITIPKPFEAGQLFTNPVESIVSNFRQTNPVETKDVLWDLIGGMFFEMAAMPSFIGPTFEVAVNHSLYFGRPIIPEWMERKKPENQFTTYNTWMAKTLGKAFGMSPAKLEYWISAQTGGLGLKVMRGIDQARHWASLEAPSISENALSRVPFISSFAAQVEHKQSRAVNEIYELSEELDALEDAGELDSNQRYLRRKVNKVKRRLSELNKRHREGRITRSELDRKKFEVAEPVVQLSKEEEK